MIDNPPIDVHATRIPPGALPGGLVIRVVGGDRLLDVRCVEDAPEADEIADDARDLAWDWATRHVGETSRVYVYSGCHGYRIIESLFCAEIIE